MMDTTVRASVDSDLKQEADELLYEAKNKGRDKVIFDDGTVL
jgi:PleD family two-component response regulator